MRRPPVHESAALRRSDDPPWRRLMDALEALFAATRAGDRDAVALLLDREPMLAHARSDSGDTPLLVALYSGAASIVELLRARGAVPDVFTAAAIGDVVALESRLGEDRSRIAAWAHDGWTPLHLAAFFGQPGATRLLLERGADVRAWSTNPTANQPLHAASVRGRLDVVDLLLMHGAELHATSEGGYTPLLLAAAGGHGTVVARLLEGGTDLAARDDGGRTAFDHARERKHEAVLEVLGAFRKVPEPGAGPEGTGGENV